MQSWVFGVGFPLLCAASVYAEPPRRGDGYIPIEDRSNPHGRPANFDGFVGLHGVGDSNRALSLELAYDNDWLRVGATVTHYQLPEGDGRELTRMLPGMTQGERSERDATLTQAAMTLGARIDGGARRTRVFPEIGFSFVKNIAPMAEGSLLGVKLGLHAEHRFGGSGHPALLADAHVLYFEDSDVHAFSGRVGVRISVLELAFRALDFNVGPALYGPEVGLQF